MTILDLEEIGFTYPSYGSHKYLFPIDCVKEREGILHYIFWLLYGGRSYLALILSNGKSLDLTNLF